MPVRKFNTGSGNEMKKYYCSCDERGDETGTGKQ
jgi:hypothetical protein